MTDWVGKIKRLKKDQLLILLLFGVLLLVIVLPAGDGKEGQQEAAGQQPADPVPEDERQVLENRLQELLGRVQGVGETQVMITLKSDGKKIVEKDREQSQNHEENTDDGGTGASISAQSSESTVYQRDGNGNESPYVSEQKKPEIAGVLVVAQGGGSASVAQEITEAVMALFGVEAHKIKVMKMD